MFRAALLFIEFSVVLTNAGGRPHLGSGLGSSSSSSSAYISRLFDGTPATPELFTFSVPMDEMEESAATTIPDVRDTPPITSRSARGSHIYAPMFGGFFSEGSGRVYGPFSDVRGDISMSRFTEPTGGTSQGGHSFQSDRSISLTGSDEYSTPYPQSGMYGPPTPYQQSGMYGPPTPYPQSGMYGPPTPYPQSGMYGPPTPYPQSGMYGPPTPFPQSGMYGPPTPYPQSGTYGPHTPYPQSGMYGPSTPFPHSGMYDPLNLGPSPAGGPYDLPLPDPSDLMDTPTGVYSFDYPSYNSAPPYNGPKYQRVPTDPSGEYELPGQMYGQLSIDGISMMSRAMDLGDFGSSSVPLSPIYDFRSGFSLYSGSPGPINPLSGSSGSGYISHSGSSYVRSPHIGSSSSVFPSAGPMYPMSGSETFDYISYIGSSNVPTPYVASSSSPMSPSSAPSKSIYGSHGSKYVSHSSSIQFPTP